MAKTGFWLRGAKGKLAGTTLYQSGGRTLQREIVTPQNPQSDNQMRQRIGFAVASKFYQNAQQNRFVLAFPAKKPNQSVFNAWMQANLTGVGTLIYPTKELMNEPGFFAYFPWICTEGSLQGLEICQSDDYTDSIGFKIKFATGSTMFTTWEELIQANTDLSLQYGDIITFTAITNDCKFEQDHVEPGTRPAVWVTRQIIIGDDLNGKTLDEYLEANGFYTIVDEDNNQGIAIDLSKAWGSDVYYGPNDETDRMPVMACVTRSRNERGTTKCSKSAFWCSLEAQQIYTYLSNDSSLYNAINSYVKATTEVAPTNILQGSIAVTPGSITGIGFFNADGTKFTEYHELPVTESDIRARDYAGRGYGVNIRAYMEGTEHISPSDFTVRATTGTTTDLIIIAHEDETTKRGRDATWSVFAVTQIATPGATYNFQIQFRGTTILQSQFTIPE